MITPNNLRSIRVKKGLSQIELSARTGISQGAISCMETGKVFPYAGWRKRLAKALGVTEKEVFPQVVSIDEK